MPSMFSTYLLGPIHLRNRVVMAPMTRVRSPSNVANEMVATYYKQRASAGLIVTEGLHISQEARGQPFTPAIYTDEQVDGLRAVCRAIHEEGGTVFAQLWHVGRQSHVSLQPQGQAPISSVARRCDMPIWVSDDNGKLGQLPASEPRPASEQDIDRLISDFSRAAERAMEAGFDGVEIHGANGYLFEQFINGELNNRTDSYGGSIENRLRLVMRTLDAVSAKIGGDRTGLRVSPFGRFGDMKEFPDEEETWLTLAAKLSSLQLAYVHVSDQQTWGVGTPDISREFLGRFRGAYSGTLILAGGLLKSNGQEVLDSKLADLIGIGKPFISNPDLVRRLENDWPLTPHDRATFYAQGPEGYIDFPTWNEQAQASGLPRSGMGI